jgi:hypothetical protein
MYDLATNDVTENLGDTGSEYTLSTVGNLNGAIYEIGQEFPGTSSDYMRFDAKSLQLSDGTNSLVIYFTGYIDVEDISSEQYLITTDSVLIPSYSLINTSRI